MISNFSTLFNLWTNKEKIMNLKTEASDKQQSGDPENKL